MSKNVLTKEEKQQKKFENKYKIFRNKIMAIIASILFIGSVTMAGIGTLPKHSSNDTLVLIASVCTVVAIILPFFIFRKPALAIMLTGAGFLDIGAILNHEGPISSGIVFFIIGLMCFMIGEKIKDKRKGNHPIKLEDEFVKDLMFNDTDYQLSTVLTHGSQLETMYKAELHLTAAVISVLTCGIGLLLPFGAKAFRYGKGAGFITSSPELVADKKHNPKKPYRNLVSNGEFFIEGKCFKIRNPYLKVANTGYILGFGYNIISTMFATLIKKPTILDEDDKTAGIVMFSSRLMKGWDAESTRALVAYSKHQSDENRQYLIDALVELHENIEEDLKREGERIESYQRERDRFASLGATGASVKTDGKNYYVEGTYDGVEGVKKLENYDCTTGVGEYTDETGKKVKIKNTNKK